MKYLVIKCEELGDQWECDANRTPICVCDNYDKYNKNGYEIYKICENGKLTLIRNYNEISKHNLVICFYNVDGTGSPKKVINIKDGDRDSVTKSLVKKIKQEYHFTDTIDAILSDVHNGGHHGEEINNKWVVFGESYDDHFPTGY